MANKLIRVGPVALTTTLTTNILNPPTGSGGTGLTATNQYLVLRKIRISNKTAGAVTFSLWMGATGANVAGTEFMGTGKSVPANDAVEWFGACRMDVADFLVGGASANTSLTFEAEAELAVF